MRRIVSLAGVVVLLSCACVPALRAQQAERPPHGQDRVPGPALSPQEAARKMTVPPGFQVEVVASEPDIVNPVAMTFDERGRIWITESLEYPRSSAGPGRDRIKVLEDTDGDGKADKFTIFAEGLNIPSGIAVGHGGVWVANAPDILFLQDTDGDGKADKREVVVTGFGRDDTHELPNSLTWGPDGWLYGLNGVFNHSHVKQGNKEWRFTCALFRIHPKTREFQLFAEGTSNPWGVAWDNEGSAFLSACVIDHLWHLVETGYYHRQGGPYPPYTWKIESIVKHKHQKAAYCGIHFFDSDAYPAEYRDRLYMGNIHGGCINVDVLSRQGSTYFAKPAPDFVTANDPWFMPVVQKTGPDGCLYILDWYDRYHCYQDARRDPGGIDRLRGRLYRVRYKETPRAPKFDLAKESDDKLVERLHSGNVFYRDLAQRLLTERNCAEVRAKLERLVLNETATRKARMHALWALIGGGNLEPGFHQKLLTHTETAYRAWGIRAAGNMGVVAPAVREQLAKLVNDSAPDVLLQVAIVSRKIRGLDAVPLLFGVLVKAGDDGLLPHIVWQNLHPLLAEQSDRFVQLMKETDLKKAPAVANLLPRVVDRMLGNRDSERVVALALSLTDGPNAEPTAARFCLQTLASRLHTGEIKAAQQVPLRKSLEPLFEKVLAADSTHPAQLDVAILAATLKERRGLKAVREALKSAQHPEAVRLRAFDALVSAVDAGLLEVAESLLADVRATSGTFRGQLLASLGRVEDPAVARVVLKHYGRMEPDLQPKAIELLTQRTAWSRELLQAIADQRVARSALNVNQVKRMVATKDKDIVDQVKKHWGTLREERNPEREQVVKEMAALLRKTPGDAKRGRAVFKNVCAQCHKMHGDGLEVGPDLTGNGRSSFDQLLSNVFDPSLVIGHAYQAVTLTTTNGRLLTGLVVEDSPQRIVLKTQGEKLETIPRGDLEEMSQSKVSLMPEGMEKQLKPQELADLFAYLVLDRPPEDPQARKIPGAP